MNKDWHAKNRIPKNARLAQRIRWQEEHAAVCACRPVSASVRAAIETKDSRR